MLLKVMVQGCERAEKGAKTDPNDKGSCHLQDLLHQKLSTLRQVHLVIACKTTFIAVPFPPEHGREARQVVLSPFHR